MVASGLTTRAIAQRVKVSQVRARYWLKKHGLRTAHCFRGDKHTHCVVCSRPINNNRCNARKCGSCTTAIRRFLAKDRAIRLLGGKCARCGFDGHPAALEFHHKTGTADKEFTIGSVSNRSWPRIEKELKKCELICSNCHRIEHSKRTSGYLETAVKNYNGKFLRLFNTGG